MNPSYKRLATDNYAQPKTKQTSPFGQRVIYKKKKCEVKKISFLNRLISICTILAIGTLILPKTYAQVIRPVYKSFKKDLVGANIDYADFYNKSANVVYNDFVDDKRVLVAPPKKVKMSVLYETEEMKNLKKKLENLAASYPSIQPSVYVWDYKTSKYVNINGDKSYSAASIIKIPVLLELFKSIERNELSIKDKFTLTDVFRASGSGELQFKAENSKYTIDELAKRMMRDSDNSATNILLYLTGGSRNINRALREWGLKETRVANWLPDLEGDNKTTAKEMATMLFNVDNQSFLNLASREAVVEYLSDIKNNRLIQAGLPQDPDILFIHKTGDIGKMLGDAGIVYSPNGDRYIVVILANRPYNAPAGKEFIVKASSIIYNSITTDKT